MQNTQKLPMGTTPEPRKSRDEIIDDIVDCYTSFGTYTDPEEFNHIVMDLLHFTVSRKQVKREYQARDIDQFFSICRHIIKHYKKANELFNELHTTGYFKVA